MRKKIPSVQVSPAAVICLQISTCPQWISHASYNPSNDFIRIINYQIFLNQLKWNHPILASTILSMNQLALYHIIGSRWAFTHSNTTHKWNKPTLSKHAKKDRMEREKEENSSCVLISVLHTWFAINGGKHEYILHHATLILTILNYINFKILLLHSTCLLYYLMNEIKSHK